MFRGFGCYAMLKVVDAVHEFDPFHHAYYVYSGELVPESLEAVEDVAVLTAAALTIVPEIALHTVLVRTMLYRGGVDPPPPTVMALLAGAHGNVVDAHGILGVPWWRIAIKLLSGAGDGQIGTPTLECLPTQHPLAERRTLYEQLSATPVLCGLFMVPYYWTPLPDASLWQQVQHGWSMVKAFPLGYALGFMAAVPLQVPYHYLHRWLKKSAKVEDGEKHLARRLRHAADNATRVRGAVSAPSLFDAGAAATAMLRPLRKATDELKGEAMEGLDTKRALLEEKLEHYREKMALCNPFQTEECVVSVDRSLGVAAALPAVDRKSVV